MRRSRGVTLIEVLIVLAIVTVAVGITMLGSGAASGARLKRSAVMIAGAIRVAYGHANATSRPVRLVFNFDARSIAIEESTSTLALTKGDRTGGAAAATEAERKAQAEAEAILKGPRMQRPSFRPVKAFGFDPEKDKQGKELERNIRFLQIDTGHQDEPARTDQAYLYFWPGGQTERAAIQLSFGGSSADGDVLMVLVSPLTGKADIRRGLHNMP